MKILYKNRILVIDRMTLFSLANACDLEHFSGNTKLDSQENFKMPEYNAPVVPMPTDPPFSNTNYQWPSNDAAIKSMTNNNPNGSTYQQMVGQDSQGWGTTNFGNNYWEGNTSNYSFDNKLLNDNLVANQFGGGGGMGPNMRPQSAYMPTSRAHIMQGEDFNGRPKGQMPKKVQVEVVKEEEPEIPFPKEKMITDQKNVWIALVILLIIVVFYVMYKTKYV